MLALRFDKCFIQFGNDTTADDSVSPEDHLGNAVDTFEGKVTFTNNNATINGDAIFITSLTACNISSKGILSYCIKLSLFLYFFFCTLFTSFIYCLKKLGV